MWLNSDRTKILLNVQCILDNFTATMLWQILVCGAKLSEMLCIQKDKDQVMIIHPKTMNSAYDVT